jgi:hypothetical protein
MGSIGTRHKALRIAAGAAPILGALWLSLLAPLLARGILAYAHNVVALVVWVVLFRTRPSRAMLPIALVVAGAVMLAGGYTVSWTCLNGAWADRFVNEALDVMPQLSQRLALSVGLSYVFLQAVHYSTWLTWIPQEELRAAGTLTFRMSWRSAQRDFGKVGLVLIAVAALVVVFASFADVHRTRGWYLSIVTFHAYLEIACLAFLVGRSPQVPGAAA